MLSISQVVHNSTVKFLRSSGIQSKLKGKMICVNGTSSEFVNNLSMWRPPSRLFSLSLNSLFQLQTTISCHYSKFEVENVEEAAVAATIYKQRAQPCKEDLVNASIPDNLVNSAYMYLKKHPKYQTMFFQHEMHSRFLTEDGRLTSVGEGEVRQSVKTFIDLCNTNPEGYITDPAYQPLFTDLINESSKLTDNELLLIIYNLRRLKRPRASDKEYTKIWHPLDRLCLHRLEQKAWTLEYMLTMADLLFSARLASESKFHWNLVKRMYRRVDKLSKEKFVRMMFCFGSVKSLPSTLSIYNIEYNLPKFIDELTPEEIAVISIGFIKTKTLIHDKTILKKMLNIVAQEKTTVGSKIISAVATAATLTPLYLLREEVYNFLDAFVSEVPRIDIRACAAVVSLGLRAKMEHREFLSAVVMKMKGNVSTIRSKGLEAICSGLSAFNVNCEELYGEIISDFQTKKLNTPMKSFCCNDGRSFLKILHNFSQRYIFPLDLISFALSDNFLTMIYGKSKNAYAEEVLLLDICMGLEVEGYDGPRLSEKCRQFLTKKNMLWIADADKETTSLYQRMARSMLQVCTDICGGLEFGHLCNIVPPFRTVAAVCCIDKGLKIPVPVPGSLVHIEDFDIKYIPETNKNINFHAFVLFPGNYVIANTLKFTGIAEMHCRQMEKMGFTVHPLLLGHTVTTPDEMKEAILKVLRPLTPAAVEKYCQAR